MGEIMKKTDPIGRQNNYDYQCFSVAMKKQITLCIHLFMDKNHKDSLKELYSYFCGILPSNCLILYYLQYCCEPW